MNFRTLKILCMDCAYVLPIHHSALLQVTPSTHTRRGGGIDITPETVGFRVMAAAGIPNLGSQPIELGHSNASGLITFASTETRAIMCLVINFREDNQISNLTSLPQQLY